MSEAVEAAVRGCKMLREAERLLAYAGFYKQACEVRDARESAEDCTVESVEDLRPLARDYTPKTIGKLVEERKDSAHV